MTWTPEEQRTYHRLYNRDWRKGIRRPKPQKHGRGWYIHHGCRCEVCVAANGAYMRAWNKAHPESSRSKVSKWRKINAKRYVAQAEAYRLLNRDRDRERLLAYRRADPARAAALTHRRRAKLAGNGGSHTAQEWREKVALFGSCCAYCGEARPLSVDHKIPITRGGTDDISNILPACMPCNRKKGVRTDREFLGLVAA